MEATSNMSRPVHRFLALAACLTLPALIGGCAEPVEDINTVQPYFIDKASLDGEWYYKQTIVDASPEVAVGFVGLEGSLEKIRWKVTEKWLYAYRTHEAVPGLEPEANREGGEYQGEPVAVFTISSHFDIKRGYNAATGEQTNVIEENAVDRPWYERQYMRVDWSTDPFGGPVAIGFVNALTESEDYIRETEAWDPDQFQLGEDHIQITYRSTLTDNGTTCYYSYGSYDCGSADARVRLSFARIDPDDHFEPRPYFDYQELRHDDGRRFRTIGLSVPLGSGQEVTRFLCTPEVLDILNASTGVSRNYTLDDCGTEEYQQSSRFGFFRTERYRYDDQLGGGHDDLREFYANVHDIWENPYRIGEDGEMTPRPYAERVPKPVVYYLNVGFPADLHRVAAQMAADWDAAFIDATAGSTGRSVAQLREILRERSDAADWQFLPGDAEGAGRMFQIRRNTCSSEGIAAYVAANPQMQAVVDEGTEGMGTRPGNLEKVCAGLTHFAREKGAAPFVWQQVGDVRFSFVNWINEPQPSGPLGYGPSSIDKETGRIVSGNAHMYGAAVDTYARSAADIVRSINEDLEIAQLVSGQSYADWLATPTSVADMQMALTAADSAALDARFGDFRVEEAYGEYRLPDGRLDYPELMRQMQRRLTDPAPGDPMAAAMATPVDEGARRLDALKQDPYFRSKLLTDEHLALVRPLFGARAGDPITDEIADAAIDLAVDPAALRARQEERLRFFADQNMFLAEFIDDSIVGQALAMKGLPADEVYRTLREEIFRAVALHEIGHTVGMTHNFEGSRDALNYPDEFWHIRETMPESEWNAARLPEYRYSTIMEYGRSFNSDTKGLGKYDHAAIKFAYGGLTEHFHPEVPLSSTLDYEVFVNGYDRIPSQLGGAWENIERRVDVPIADHVDAMRAGILENTRRFIENPTRPVGDYWFDRQVPYGYCFDVFRGNINCQTWDEGATYTETVRSAIQQYWNYYVFNNYRRGRNEGGFVNGYFSRQSRVEWYLTTFFRYFYYYQQWDIGLRRDLEQAALIGLNFINQVLGTPEPGTHCYDEKQNLYVPYRQANPEVRAACAPVEIGEGTGRGQHLRYNDDYYYQIDYIGSYYDKINLMYSLADTSTSFFRVSNIGDSRAFSIGYYRVFQPELVELLHSMILAWLGDAAGEAYASYVMDDSVMPKVLFAEETFGQDPDAMEGVPQVHAPVSYNMIWQGLALYAAFNTSIYDAQLDFSEYIAVSERGSGDARTYPEGWRIASFTDPHTGVIYDAAQTRDQRSIAFDLVTRAGLFVAEVWRPAKDALDARPGDPQLRAEYEAADRKLGRYTDLISDLRFMRAVVDIADD